MAKRSRTAIHSSPEYRRLTKSELLSWDVRIANLYKIDYAGSEPVIQSTFPELLHVRVDYVGNYLLILLLAFAAYLSTYVYYLLVQGYLSSRITHVAYVVIAALLALFAADATVTYLTGPFDGVNHALNAPVLMANFLLLCWIAFRLYQKKGNDEASDPIHS